MSDYIASYCHLHSAAESALIAYYSDGVRRKSHAQDCRDHVVQAISGSSAGTSREEAYDLLIDLIDIAITDTLDVDWTTECAAKAVVAAILDAVAPLPKHDAQVKEAAA